MIQLMVLWLVSAVIGQWFLYGIFGINRDNELNQASQIAASAKYCARHQQRGFSSDRNVLGTPCYGQEERRGNAVIELA